MDNVAHRAFKDQLYDQFARIGKALASPHRLEILDLLAQSERSVEDVARETGMSVANASQHLQTLRAAQLVTVRRDGIYAYYRLADGQVFRLWQTVRDIGTARLAEIDRLATDFLGDRSTLEPVEAAELLERLRQGDVVLLDVRPEEEYRAGHLPGARSVPLAALEAQASQFPRGREIVAYCRGPYCLFSDEAVALLRARGYPARRLAFGFPDWQAAGLPVAA